MSDMTELTGERRVIFDCGFQMGVENALRLRRIGHSDNEIRKELELMLRYLRVPCPIPLQDIFGEEEARP